MKKFVSCILLLTMILSLAACEKEDKNSVLSVAAYPYQIINPVLSNQGDIDMLVFSGLTGRNENGRAIPDIARSWEYDEKGLTYTFELRDDVYFHDGERLTADDAKFTIEAAMSPGNNAVIASNFTDIREVVVRDENTLIIELLRPNVALPSYLNIGILPKHLLEGKSIDSLNRNPVGTGPFKLADWNEQGIVLESFENFYKGRAEIKEIQIKFVDDYDERVSQLKSGDVMMSLIRPDDAYEFLDEREMVVHYLRATDCRVIMYNFNDGFFSRHPELSNAMSYGIDRTSIVEEFLRFCGEAAYSPLQYGDYNNKDIKKLAFNVVWIQELLNVSLWRMGEDGIREKNGEKLSFDLAVPENNEISIGMAQLISEKLLEFGVDMDVVVVGPEMIFDYDSYITSISSPLDPDDSTYKYFATDQPENRNGYSNQLIDRYLAKARGETDIQERIELYSDFLVTLTYDTSCSFIAYVDAIYATKPNITGIKPETVLSKDGSGIFWNVHEWEIG